MSRYFDGELSGVRVEWQTLDNRLGGAEKIGEHDYRIWIDRRENTSIADVRDTLQHEVCHVLVDWQEAEEHGTWHHTAATKRKLALAQKKIWAAKHKRK